MKAFIAMSEEGHGKEGRNNSCFVMGMAEGVGEIRDGNSREWKSMEGVAIAFSLFSRGPTGSMLS